MVMLVPTASTGHKVVRAKGVPRAALSRSGCLGADTRNTAAFTR